ncbi:MAG: DoxX family membrane protein [Propionibacteriaceae bacterium]|jgi:uncharacterized membrane protein YphA (DoxX/SURF4 family)|nr:DoxX family membrane protein [Propionibacteriaceae bacterium]
MSFIRFAARSLLASYFIADGCKAVVQPSPLVEDAETTAQGFSRAASRYLPESVAERIPTETKTLVRIHGGIEAVAGVMIATGLGRRLGATVLAISYLPKAISHRPRRSARSAGVSATAVFNRDLALIGALVLEALDTEGKPDLGWLAADRKKRLTHVAQQTAKATKKATKRKANELRDQINDTFC